MCQKNSFNARIADLNIKILHKHSYTRKHCEDYIISDECDADIVASTNKEQMDAEARVSEFTPTEAYCENICLYRSIAEQLPSRSRFVFHGASVEIDGKGFIFTAPSGTGKSTHVNLLLKNYGDRVKIINGDKPIIESLDTHAIIHSTPWAGKERWQRNTKAKLCGICILKRGIQNSIKKIDPSKYFSHLINQVYIPNDPTERLLTLELVDRLSRNVPFYLLECNISDEAAATSFNELTKQ